MLESDANNITIRIVVEDRIVIQITCIHNLGCSQLKVKGIGILEISSLHRS